MGELLAVCEKELAREPAKDIAGSEDVPESSFNEIEEAVETEGDSIRESEGAEEIEALSDCEEVPEAEAASDDGRVPEVETIPT